ncbi:MAG TPA: cache domain-containing protein, partial [Xanthobacteraceae bacterium]|nr:cache domain-containing protein [Xanthobacteraceae bacterium]
MLKIRSISARVVLAITLTVAAACATLTAFSIIQQQSLTRLALEQELQVQYQSVIAAIDYEGRVAMAATGVIAGLPPLAEAIAKGDRDGVVALLAGSHAALKAQGFPLMTMFSPPATGFVRLHDPKAFGDDASARRKTVVTANTKGTPIVGVENARGGALAVFAMTPVMRDGKSLAAVDIGMDFGKAFADRIKQRLGVDIAIHSFDGQKFATAASTFAEQTAASPEDLQSAFAGTAVNRESEIGGRPVAVRLGLIRNYAGEPFAVLELVKDTTQYQAARTNTLRSLVLAAAVILLLAGLGAFLLGRGLSRPVAALTETMNRLSGGDTGIAIPGRARADELGTMAKAVEVFRQSMIEAEHLRSEQTETEKRTATQRKADMRRMADAFEAAVGEIVGAVSTASSELEASATSMSRTAENTQRLSGIVTSASEEASANVQSVAGAS